MKPVNIVSISFVLDTLSEDKILEMVKAGIRKDTDIVLLPETCTGTTRLHGADDFFLSEIRRLAAGQSVYILCPVYLEREGRRFNSALLFDRRGEIIMCYDKVYPYWSEYDIAPPATPGKEVCSVVTDFGTVSAAICFDANFPLLWNDIARRGAEIVFWVSAYSGARQLAAHALNHHYMIVTASGYADCTAYDIDGREIFFDFDGGKPLVSYLTVDLDRVVCHYDFHSTKIAKLLKEHPEIKLQHDYHKERWYILHSEQSECNVRAICKDYGIENLRDYKARSRIFADELRGGS